MKLMIRLSKVCNDEIAESELQALGKIYPEGLTGTGFSFDLPFVDERITAVLAYLADLGKTPGSRFCRKKGELSLKYKRVYDEIDYEAAAYLEPRPRVAFRSYTRSENGLIELEPHVLGLNADIGFPRAGVIVVSDSLRERIESAGLKRLSFLPTMVPADAKSELGEATKYWELSSDLILPPVSPSCVIVDGKGQPFQCDYQKGCLIDEGFYTSPELRYRALDIVSVEPFDFAITHELFGACKAAEPYMIASQRFYRFCVEQKLNMDWIPVRIDED